MTRFSAGSSMIMRFSNILVAMVALSALGACSDRAQTQADAAGDDLVQTAKKVGDAIETMGKDAASDIEEATEISARKADAATNAALTRVIQSADADEAPTFMRDPAEARRRGSSAFLSRRPDAAFPPK
jgi:hypothetical protein